jgi:hypothetical protein
VACLSLRRVFADRLVFNLLVICLLRPQREGSLRSSRKQSKRPASTMCAAGEKTERMKRADSTAR